MIWVKFQTRNDAFVTLDVSGHADFREEGQDIVCAAVSLSSVGLLNAIDEMEPDSFRLHVGEPSVELNAYDHQSKAIVPAEWRCSDESALAIEVTESGTCVITPLKAVQGGVQLIASYGGMYVSVIVYVGD